MITQKMYFTIGAVVTKVTLLAHDYEYETKAGITKKNSLYQ